MRYSKAKRLKSVGEPKSGSEAEGTSGGGLGNKSGIESEGKSENGSDCGSDGVLDG